MTTRKTIRHKTSQISSRELARKAARLALEKKAEDIVILDVRELTTITDFFVIMTGAIDSHIKAIIDHIEEKLKPETSPWFIEGYEYLEWVVMDYIDFVVHIFSPEKRNYYDLERIWGDAPKEIIRDVE